MSLAGLALAAGYGKRMRPLTANLPKPLLTLSEVPILYLALNNFLSAGIEKVAVNAHYLAPMIERACRDNPFGLSIKVSIEQPEIYGSAGALVPLKSWLGSDDIAIVNSDVITDIQLQDVYQEHVSSGNLVTMVTVDARAHLESGLAVDANGNVLGVAKRDQCTENFQTFTGYYILSNSVVGSIENKLPQCVLKDVILPLTKQEGKVRAFFHSGYWHDLGEVNEYHAMQKLIREQAIETSRQPALKSVIASLYDVRRKLLPDQWQGV